MRIKKIFPNCIFIFYFFDYADDDYKEFFFPNKCDSHWNSKGYK